MIIVYGTRGFDKQVGALLDQPTCNGCGLEGQHILMRNRRWVTLFWIPIFPFSSDYHAICPRCGQAYNVNKDRAKRNIEAGKRQIEYMAEQQRIEQVAQQEIAQQEQPLQLNALSEENMVE